MDKLDKIMSENRELFLDQEPPTGHMLRFEEKLAKQNRKVKVITLSKRISRIAAIGLLAIMSSLWAYNQFLAPESDMLTLSDINNEYSEVEFYLTSQIDQKYDQLLNNDILNESDYKETLDLEMANMDSVYTKLQKELGANPSDERIIQAMIGYYQTKLRVISQIINQLERLEENESVQINNQDQYESVKL